MTERWCIFRELAEPQKLLGHLLKPAIAHLASDTIGVYLQAVLKTFGVWAAELSQTWDNDDISKVKATVNEVVEGLRPFTSNANVEVQERV